MSDKIYKVLILCTGNSARSIMAEGLFNSLGKGRFIAYSAGSHPIGKVNPFALERLALENIIIENPRSKSWDEFALADAPELDFIITVCDHAKGETCPIWPGKPISAHWGVPDPKGNSDEEKRLAFSSAFDALKKRVSLFVSLDLARLDQEALKQKMHEIGQEI